MAARTKHRLGTARKHYWVVGVGVGGWGLKPVSRAQTSQHDSLPSYCEYIQTKAPSKFITVVSLKFRTEKFFFLNVPIFRNSYQQIFLVFEILEAYFYLYFHFSAFLTFLSPWA